MRIRFLKVVRFSSIGVFFTGIIGVIQGCSVEREGALFAVLLFLLNFCSGPVTEETTPFVPTAIILYDSGIEDDGALGNRMVTTNSCKMNLPAGYTRFIALLSYTGDAVVDFKDLPGFDETFPVTGPTGVPIGDNWDDLFDNTILNNMRTAIPGIKAVYWTGTQGTGTPDAKNCIDWTHTSTFTEEGVVGRASRSDSGWLEDGDNICRTSIRGLICVAY